MDLARFRFTGHDIDLTKVETKAPKSAYRDEIRARTAELTTQLAAVQEQFYADGRHRLLIVLQATDTGGKDGTIRNVFGPMNPHGVRVVPFKGPTSTELERDYLWRVHKEVPGDGELTIFNRSHYEDVLIVRVHNLVPESRWKHRYKHIANFEKMLIDEGTTIVKIFLHISKDEQRERLQDRLDQPNKRWKFAASDLSEREHWDDYQRAFEAMISKTATKRAPWYVVPADNKWYRDYVVANIVLSTMNGLDLRYPEGPAAPESIVIPS